VGINSAKGILVPGSNFSFNFTYKTPLNWIIPAFVAYRGSTNWVFNIDAPAPVGHVRVWRSNQQGYGASENITNFTRGSPSANAAFFFNNSDSGAAGQALTNQNTNAGLSVMCPNYGKYRFQSTSMIYATNTSIAPDDAPFDEFVLEVVTDGVSGVTDQGLKIWSYNSIGTDFGVHFFLNVPVLYRYSSVPIAN